MNQVKTDLVNPSYVTLSKEQLLDLPLEDLGLSHFNLKRFHSLHITTIRELNEYLLYHKNHHLFCSGKYLTRTMMKELTISLQTNHIAWTLEDLIGPTEK